MKAVAAITALLGVAVASTNMAAGAAAANEKHIMKRQDGATLGKPSSH